MDRNLFFPIACSYSRIQLVFIGPVSSSLGLPRNKHEPGCLHPVSREDSVAFRYPPTSLVVLGELHSSNLIYHFYLFYVGQYFYVFGIFPAQYIDIYSVSSPPLHLSHETGAKVGKRTPKYLGTQLHRDCYRRFRRCQLATPLASRYETSPTRLIGPGHQSPAVGRKEDKISFAA